MLAFAEALPRTRRRVQKDLRRRGLPREKVLATIVLLLETTLIRVGNEEYARHNHSYGLTTLRDPHARVSKKDILFEFRGKGGLRRRVTVHDGRLAQIVKRCRDLPGQELFQYVDAKGKRHSVGSADVNSYLQVIGGAEFSAKDFHTWAATLLAFRALAHAKGRSPASRRKSCLRCIQEVANELSNTPAICRKCYIHPQLVTDYLEGSLKISLKAGRKRDDRALLKWRSASQMLQNLPGSPAAAHHGAAGGAGKLQLGRLAREE
jgi:DNA topoisomerase-1